MKKRSLLLAISVFLSLHIAHAQKIGLLTNTPQAPVHISSSGQVNTPGGLLVLGDTSEAHMELDFDILQSNFGQNPTSLKLQPYGGKVGINTPFPQAPFHLSSSGQVNTPGGLALLGDLNEGHMIMDFDLLQSSFGAASYLPLRVQPSGGNLNVGNGLIFADRTNNFVGINTSSPTTELQLHGEMRLTTSGLATAQKDKIAIFGNLEDAGTVGLGWIKISGGIGGGIADTSSSSRRSLIDTYEMYYKSQGAHRWFINELADVNTPDMILNNVGDLGLGISAPDSKFHITNGYGASLSGKGYMQLGPTNASNIVMDPNEVQARSNGAASTLFLQFWGGNLSLCNSANTGVGIGNTNPVSKLHITGGADAGLATQGYLVTGPTSGANIVLDDNEIMARNNGAASPFYVQHDAGNLFLCGLKNGQVGIGINSQTSLPSSEFLLAVDGKIISEEVRVELSGNWPDYVFKKEYTLKPLDQLKNEINITGHLPGMPSASMVEEEGFELGDMQRRLLEKVEELTLYVIDLHNANKELTREIELLKSKVKGTE
ncbi:MAG TPA: hypothetical protein VFG10_12225 [Saprospiraceae bacterium]|nr:hypothetical protein [Saprospiraceae bacterium]